MKENPYKSRTSRFRRALAHIIIHRNCAELGEKAKRFHDFSTAYFLSAKKKSFEINVFGLYQIAC